MNKKYLKRDPIKDYFPLPNEIFCLRLSYGEIAVYSYLLYRENRKSFQCYPSYRSIGKALKMSWNTVSKYVQLLANKELITTEPTSVFTKSNKKLNGYLLYTILKQSSIFTSVSLKILDKPSRMISGERR
mgnify:CR=1 FL=1